ncbi:MAG: peptide deformylase [Alphaproteobacteria bacterium]|nr:peptide deformylase [Alphaproteobacteria bacterium]
MAILKIAQMGHPVLRRRAAPVADPRDPQVAALVHDMLETLADSEGIGLAAPQVHASRRVVLLSVPGLIAEERGGGEEVPLTVLVNPVIEALTDELELGWEGCLSLPGLRGKVPRFRRVRYRGIDLAGEVIERVAEGYHARVIQHECDHLDGILYPQRMTDLSLLVFESELRHLIDDPAEREAAQRAD